MSRLDRQNFLGSSSDQILRGLTVGCVGLGGGGSHVSQQLAHLGVGKFVLIDADIIEDSNLNRLVGGTFDDVRHKRLKVDIAKRSILAVNPDAQVITRNVDWQMALEELKDCDIVVGGLDSVIAKDDLDRFCRRHLMPYIDMGMDVHDLGGQYLIAGQVVLSMPGCACLRCYGVVTEDGRTKEAQRYGAAGSRPQVVWPNGVLASLAVGTLTQMVTPWHRGIPPAYLEYDGNKNTVSVSPRVAALAGRPCPHVLPTDIGDARFDIRGEQSQQAPPEAIAGRSASSTQQPRRGLVRGLLDWFRDLL